MKTYTVTGYVTCEVTAEFEDDGSDLQGQAYDALRLDGDRTDCFEVEVDAIHE